MGDVPDDPQRQPLLVVSQKKKKDEDSTFAALHGRKVREKRFFIILFATIVASCFVAISKSKTSFSSLGASPLTMRNLHEIFKESNANSGDPVISALKRDNLFNVKTFPERASEYQGDLHDQIGADASWFHKPIKGINEENEGKFKMCLMGGIESWDVVYVDLSLIHI